MKKFSSYINETIIHQTCSTNDIYLTLDNAGLPFVVNVKDKHKQVTIFEDIKTYSNVEKVFYGTDKTGDKNKKGDENSTILLKLKDKNDSSTLPDNKNVYVWVGSGIIYEFTTEDKIKQFSSPVGNSAVPYPFAIGDKNIYFFLDNVYVNKNEFDEQVKNIKDSKYPCDTYGKFYELRKSKLIKTHNMMNLNIIKKSEMRKDIIPQNITWKENEAKSGSKEIIKFLRTFENKKKLSKEDIDLIYFIYNKCRLVK